MKKILLLSSLLCLNYAANAQTALSNEIAYKVKNEAFNNSKIEEIAQFMTDYLGPRLAASNLKVRSEQLTMEKLDELGCSNSRIEFAADFPSGGWDNEKTYVAMTAPYYCSFSANPKAWSGSTNGPVKGECIVANIQNQEDIEKYRGKLAGKVLLMPTSEQYEMSFEPLARRYTDEQLNEMAKDSRPYNRRRTVLNNDYFKKRELLRQLYDLLKEEQVLAIISGSGTFNVPNSRGVQYKVGDPKPITEIVLPLEDHNRMVRLVNKGVPVEMELDVKNTFTDNQKVNNVIAEIPGTDPKLKNEIVMIGAHLDSWHGGTGAADNASGCIVMMEAMRIIKELGIQPKRTIRIALWGGEEQGLFGSKGYAMNEIFNAKEQKKLPGYDKFALYLNMDNGSGRFRGIHLEENDQAIPFMQTWGKSLESLGFKTLSIRSTNNTDHVTFSRLGLPAFQFIQDPLEYRRTYHTLMDCYERLSINDLKVNATMIAWLALNAAMDSERIPAKPGYPLIENKKN